MIPRALASTRFELARSASSPASLALRLQNEPELIKPFVLRFDEQDGATLSGVSLVSSGDDGRLLLFAATAGARLAEDDSILELALNHGGAIRMGPDNVPGLNTRFERLTLRYDARRLFEGGGTVVLSPIFYPNRELDRLPEVIREREQRGLIMRKKKKLELGRSIPQVKAARLQSALNPFLVLLLVVTALGVHLPGDPKRRTLAVLGVCLLFLLPQQVVLEAKAGRGALPGAWAALLPSIESLVLIIAAAAERALNRRTG